MAEDGGDRPPLEEGKVFALGEERWQDFPPKADVVLEFEGRGSEEEDGSLVWCALLCTELRDLASGDVLAIGRFLGSENEYSRKLYAGLINRRNQGVHFCRSSPCDLGDEETLGGVAAHSKRGRFWSPEKYEGSFLQPWGKLVLKEYIDKGLVKPRRRKEESAEVPGKEGKDPGRKKKRPGSRPSGRADPVKPKDTKKDKKRKKPEDGGEKDLGQVGALREKLRRLRARMSGEQAPPAPEVVDVGSSEESGSDPDAFTSALVRRALSTGDQMNPHISHLGYGQETMKLEDSKDGTMSRRRPKKRRSSASDPRRTSSQLLAVAEQREASRKEDHRRKRGRKSGSLRARAVVRLLKGKAKKTKKGDDPSEDGSSSEERSSSQESSSDSEPLAPLLKKSLKSPGKVLRLLVEHAQQALDQSALAETGESNAVTGGVKMATYFNLLIRPYHPTTSRDTKELHQLAICLDELRSGRLGALGDSLASRFLAIHSAVNEGGWRAAQFLELHPLEPTQSPPTSLLLKAKKHAHVVAKSQGNDNSSRWSRSGGPGMAEVGIQRKRKRKREEGQRLERKRLERPKLQLVARRRRMVRQAELVGQGKGKERRQEGGCKESRQMRSREEGRKSYKRSEEAPHMMRGFEGLKKIAEAAPTLKAAGCLLVWMLVHCRASVMELGRWSGTAK